MGQQTMVHGLATCCSNKVLLNQKYTCSFVLSFVLSCVCFPRLQNCISHNSKIFTLWPPRKSLLTPDLCLKENELLTHNHLCLSFSLYKCNVVV